ncbi:MAG: lysophospholipid acyltransferase family protein, partial [Nitrosospira sp.]|nr:lysophospholipid acyltransferase family protein [Nitrosospira sp.]
MSEASSLTAPRYWPSWTAMALGRCIGALPYRLQMVMGRRLGDLARLLVGERRRVALTNIRLCFPELTEHEQQRLLRAHFRAVGMGAMETAICWWGRDATIRRLSSIEGLDNLRTAADRGRGIILLSAHFTSLELGVRIGQRYLREFGIETTAMYKPPHDPVVDHVMRTRREAHIGGKSIPYNDIKGFLRALRRGHAVWYAGDQKASGRLGELVEFFGQPALTHTAISRLARVTGATIVPFFTLRRQDGRG